MTTPREFPVTASLDYRGAALLADVAATSPGEHSSVTQAKLDLAETRADALASLEEFKGLCEAYRPAFDAAFAAYQDAVKIGIGHHPAAKDVHDHVQKVRTLMTGGAASLQSIPVEIDNLTQYVVYQGGALRITGRYKMAKENIAALTTMADKLPHVLRGLDELLSSSAVRLPVAPTGYNNDMEQRSEIRVESRFDTRR